VSRFLSKTNQEMYGTHQWGLNWSVLWDYIKKGFPRGIGLLMINSSWLCSVYVISYRDKIALDVMSLSGSINLFVSFIGDALYRTLISLVSNALGAKDYSQVWKYIRKGVIALLVIGTLLAVPFIVFPDKLILLFHTKNLLDPWVEATLQSTFFWLWVQSLIYMFNNVWVSVIFAIKDTLFLLFVNIGSWLTIFLPIYVMSQFVEMMPSTFWALVCLGLSASSVMYISRVVYQLRQLTAHSPT
jgi:Na+-driven multidrug efflux pump